MECDSTLWQHSPGVGPPHSAPLKEGSLPLKIREREVSNCRTNGVPLGLPRDVRADWVVYGGLIVTTPSGIFPPRVLSTDVDPLPSVWCRVVPTASTGLWWGLWVAGGCSALATPHTSRVNGTLSPPRRGESMVEAIPMAVKRLAMGRKLEVGVDIVDGMPAG